MANDDILRKDLFANGLKNISQLDWIRTADKLNLTISRSKSGTSHYLSLRDPKNTNPNDSKSLISTVMPNLYKEANKTIFKNILRYGKNNGISEDDIWKALGKL
ncbi:MAG: hypothetical protein WC735_01855 [Candidatus Paceibacterota bacterium]|jgi:hypothetical protein